MVSPVKIFSSIDNADKQASEVLLDQRNRDKEMFIEERSKRLKLLLETLIPKDDFEKKQLKNLKNELEFLL